MFFGFYGDQEKKNAQSNFTYFLCKRSVYSWPRPHPGVLDADLFLVVSKPQQITGASDQQHFLDLVGSWFFRGDAWLPRCIHPIRLVAIPVHRHRMHLAVWFDPFWQELGAVQLNGSVNNESGHYHCNRISSGDLI